MLAAYRQAAAARAALGIPPLPLTAQETAALVELLISHRRMKILRFCLICSPTVCRPASMMPPR